MQERKVVEVGDIEINSTCSNNVDYSKKVKRRRILYDFNDKPYAIKGDCPRCGNGQLVSTLEQYCPKCGQKLDWSE